MLTMDKETMDSLFGTYSDMYKDANGFRPRHDVSNWTEADFKAEFARLDAIITEQMAEEKIEQAKAVVRFEKRIQETIAMGAGNRETAIKWIMDAEQVDGDKEYLCYLLGLPYTYFGTRNALYA